MNHRYNNYCVIDLFDLYIFFVLSFVMSVHLTKLFFVCLYLLLLHSVFVHIYILLAKSLRFFMLTRTRSF